MFVGLPHALQRYVEVGTFGAWLRRIALAARSGGGEGSVRKRHRLAWGAVVTGDAHVPVMARNAPNLTVNSRQLAWRSHLVVAIGVEVGHSTVAVARNSPTRRPKACDAVRCSRAQDDDRPLNSRENLYQHGPAQVVPCQRRQSRVAGRFATFHYIELGATSIAGTALSR